MSRTPSSKTNLPRRTTESYRKDDGNWNWNANKGNVNGNWNVRRPRVAKDAISLPIGKTQQERSYQTIKKGKKGKKMHLKKQ